MADEERTPTTAEVREAFSEMSGWDMSADEADATFDSWLAGVIAEKRTEWEAEQGEVEWEYGISYAPGYEEFEGQDLPTIQRRVMYIRRQGGYYSRMVRAIRRHPAGDAVPVNENGDSK